MEITTALYISVAVSFALAIIVVALVGRLSSLSKYLPPDHQSEHLEDNDEYED